MEIRGEGTFQEVVSGVTLINDNVRKVDATLNQIDEGLSRTETAIMVSRDLGPAGSVLQV